MASDPNIQGNSHAAAPRSVGIGNRNDNPAQWAPFTWDDPHFGPQVKGEVAPVAFDHTSGSLQLGFWRTGKGIPGCNEDGSCHVDYSAPLGDETMPLNAEKQEKVAAYAGQEIFYGVRPEFVGLSDGPFPEQPRRHGATLCSPQL